MKVNKLIDYSFKDNMLNAGINLFTNQCFQNCLTGIEFDNEKLFSLGFSVIAGTRFMALHGWLEDDSTIYELTLPVQNNIKYYKAFDISFRQLNKYLPIKSLDCLIDHRHFILSYCKTHNFMLNKGYIFGYNQQLIPCKLPLIKKVLAFLGHIERKLLTK